MEPTWTEMELFAWCYGACLASAFGAYARSTEDWEFKQGFGRTFYAANTGMIVAMLSFQFIGLKRPWQMIGIACSTSIGWTRINDIKGLIKHILTSWTSK